LQNPLQEVPVAMRLIFGAMAQERHVSALAQSLQKPEREFLPVIFDGWVALIYWAGFSQHLATGTSLAVLLPPIGLAATLEYYRHGNVDFRAAILLAIGLFTGSWIGAYAANKLPGPQLRLLFGVFLTLLGVYLVHGAFRRLGWI